MADFQYFPSTSPFAHLGQAPAVAYNSDAPEDEVRDAGEEIMEDYYQAPAIGITDMVSQLLQLRRVEQVGDRLMAKALRYSNPGAGEAKAETEGWNSRVTGGGLYTPKPGLTFQTLRQLSQRIEVARAIHNTIQSQVIRFAEPSQKDDVLGWKILHQDPNRKLVPDEEEFFQWLTSFLLCGGREFNALKRRKLRREGFRKFLSKVVEDSLTLDHVAIETIPLKGFDGLDSFFVRDGATFYLASHPSNGTKVDDDGIFAYQVLANATAAQRNFKFEELALFQRNMTSDIEWSGYGKSELESSVDTIAMFLQALAHTREGIDSNAIPKGFLTIFGSFDRRTQDAFKNAWSAQLRGVRNQWNLPVLFAKNGQAAAQFTTTGTPFSEMAFAKWIQLQSAIMCSIYGLDPGEIGLESWSAGGKSNLSGDDTEQKLASSRSKCLGPLLSSLAGFLSEDLLARFSDSARHHFTGLEEVDRKARKELQTRVSTINEIRASLQMPPHPLAWFGELPADAGLMEAEFKRIQSSGTFNEGRKIWGGFEAFPDERVGMNPLNPSMGASWNQVVQSAAPPEEPQPGEEPPFAGGPPGDEEDHPEWEGEGDDGGGEGGSEGGSEGEDTPPEENPPPGHRTQEMTRNFDGMK